MLVGEHARATMVWALHAYILLGLRRATRPSMHGPRRLAMSERRRNIVMEIGTVMCRRDWSACGAWQLALDRAWDAA